nr:phenylalanine--tRNA ligase subunit beta [Deltaproteobacteria bacterium]
MRVSLSWLRSLVPVSLDTPALVELLTRAGLEVDAIHTVGALDPLSRVGRVVSRKALQSATHFVIDAGPSHPAVSVVSKAPNAERFDVGATVAIALPGATIIDGHGDDFALVTVASAKVYGVQSDGVLCSERELGVGDDHTGLIALATEAPNGTALSAVLPIPDGAEADEVLEVAILPNFARCLSMVGVAREVAALTGAQGHYDVALDELDVVSGELDAQVEATDACRRFSTARVEGVRAVASPRWMQRRLALAGVAVIDHLVDVTNYCMIELGQPMHGYDLARLGASTVGVRRAREGEAARLLNRADGEPAVALPAGTLIITAGDVPVGVAGVIGGSDTAMRADTTSVLLESACFDWPSVRRSSAALKVHTDASTRFARGVDPTLSVLAIRRAVRLWREWSSPDLKVTATGDWQRAPIVPGVVKFTQQGIASVLGLEATKAELTEALARVGITVREAAGGALEAVVPPGREDVTRPCDLAEEFARVTGFDRIPETMPGEALPFHTPSRRYTLREGLRDALVRGGLQELLTYSLIAPESEALLGAEPDETPRLKVLNPINVNRTSLRRTLLAGLMETLRENHRHTPDAQVFEIGVVFLPELPSPYGRGLPAEKLRVSFALTGRIERASMHGGADRGADLFDGVAVVEHLLRALRLRGVEIVAEEAAPYQPGLCAALRKGEKHYGRFGVVHPEACARFDMEGRRVVAGELDLDALLDEAGTTFKTLAPPRFPSLPIDVSMFVGRAVSAGQVVATALGAGGALLKGVEVIDEFSGAQVPEGMRSLAIRLELNAGDRSLTAADAQAVRVLVTTALTAALAAQVRE